MRDQLRGIKSGRANNVAYRRVEQALLKNFAPCVVMWQLHLSNNRIKLKAIVDNADVHTEFACFYALMQVEL